MTDASDEFLASAIRTAFIHLHGLMKEAIDRDMRVEASPLERRKLPDVVESDRDDEQERYRNRHIGQMVIDPLGEVEEWHIKITRRTEF